jgi:hypothetical protein
MESGSSWAALQGKALAAKYVIVTDVETDLIWQLLCIY